MYSKNKTKKIRLLSNTKSTITMTTKYPHDIAQQAINSSNNNENEKTEANNYWLKANTNTKHSIDSHSFVKYKYKISYPFHHQQMRVASK